MNNKKSIFKKKYKTNNIQKSMHAFLIFSGFTQLKKKIFIVVKM